MSQILKADSSSGTLMAAQGKMYASGIFVFCGKNKVQDMLVPAKLLTYEFLPHLVQASLM
ncbi:hypothetical protein ACO0LL_21170 [Undibacterium sp. TC4M20W]|uniref:hypothetical protein n=1 Tax=Undibacterium sp. TC4M20W TaxID=3413052 RepID=UPI003BF41A61